MAHLLRDRFCEPCGWWFNASRIPPHAPPPCPLRAPCHQSAAQEGSTHPTGPIQHRGPHRGRSATPRVPKPLTSFLSQAALDTQDTAPLPSVSDVITSPIPSSCLFQVIPTAARPAMARLLMKALSQANTMSKWPERMHEALLQLHMIPRAVTRRLWPGEQGWRKDEVQLSALMNRITRAMRGNQWTSLWREAHEAFQTFTLGSSGRSAAPQRTPKVDTFCSDVGAARRRRSATRVSMLAAQGYYRRAVQAVDSNDKVDTRDPKIFSQLEAMHPPRNIPLKLRRSDLLPSHTEVDESTVRRALMRMDTTSAAGTDGMSVRLLRLLLLDVALVGPDQTGISVLTQFVNLALRGSLPAKSHQLLASARLVALPKGSGRIRPVAVGNVLRRLVAKASMPHAIAECRDFLQSYQFATATPCGLDVIVHRIRELVRVHGTCAHMAHVSIDAKNAFNMVERQKMLDAVRAHAPSLSRWTYFMYATGDPMLVSQGGIIRSQQGTQQGNPCSMLLFSLTIHDLVLRVARETDLLFNAWYADDAHIVGSVNQIMKALRIVQQHGPQVNYILQPHKSEIFWPVASSVIRRPLLRCFPMRQLDGEGMLVLGAPIGNTSFMQQTVANIIDTCDETLARLRDLMGTGSLDARVPFVLQRACLSQPKLNHVLRLTPTNSIAAELRRADAVMCHWYQVLNNLVLTDDARQQLILPVSLGGQGFHGAIMTAEAAYLASLIDVVRHQELCSHRRTDNTHGTPLQGKFSPGTTRTLQDASRVEQADPRLSANRQPLSTPPPNAGQTMSSATTRSTERVPTRQTQRGLHPPRVPGMPAVTTIPKHDTRGTSEVHPSHTISAQRGHTTTPQCSSRLLRSHQRTECGAERQSAAMWVRWHTDWRHNGTVLGTQSR